MAIKNGDVLSMFQSGNEQMEKAVLASGVSKSAMKKAQNWQPPAKMPKDFMAIGDVLQTFVTK